MFINFSHGHAQARARGRPCPLSSRAQPGCPRSQEVGGRPRIPGVCPTTGRHAVALTLCPASRPWFPTTTPYMDPSKPTPMPFAALRLSHMLYALGETPRCSDVAGNRGAPANSCVSALSAIAWRALLSSPLSCRCSKPGKGHVWFKNSFGFNKGYLPTHEASPMVGWLVGNN